MTLDQVVTPYSTITPFVSSKPNWMDEADAERVAAYDAYDNMYWSVEQAFALIRRASDGPPIYVPKPKVIVDSTAHYLLKGLQITLEDPERDKEFDKFLRDFLKREKFYSRFAVAKHAGVVKGDWVLHITADPRSRPGSRVSLVSVNPSRYFPEHDPDDLDKIKRVRLIEQQLHPDDNQKTILKILEYWYEGSLVWRTENMWEMEGWNNPKRAKKLKQLIAPGPLPSAITQIPVYHFRNAEWDDLPFGNSELKGFENLFASVNQTVSDTDLALALVGLGVYATDAGRPVDEETGQEVDWEVSPGKVLEVPGATLFKRLEGITTVTPVYDHVSYLEKTLHQASGTSDVALGEVDPATAESGIALAIKFMPTLAKIETRDQTGIDVLTQLFYDIKFWFLAYEGKDYLDIDLIPKIGEKLPINRAKLVEELNNMIDRNVISRQYYRVKMQELGYEFPDDIDKQVLDEIKEMQEAKTPPQILDAQGNPQGIPGPGGRKAGPGDTLSAKDKNQSNNKGKVNESKGTEVKR